MRLPTTPRSFGVVVELTDIPNELATRRPVPLALASIKRRFLGPRGVKSHVPQRTAGYLGLIADFLDQAMVTNWPFRITKYVLTYLNSMLEFSNNNQYVSQCRRPVRSTLLHLIAGQFAWRDSRIDHHVSHLYGEILCHRRLSLN